MSYERINSVAGLVRGDVGTVYGGNISGEIAIVGK